MPTPPGRTGRLARRAVRAALRRAATGSLSAALFAVEVYADLLPGVRMVGPRRLPNTMGPGVLGAEAATWWAISPSLLPRPWWVTALNVAFCQGFGHAVGTGIHFASVRAFDALGHRPTPRVTHGTHRVLHTVLGATTAAVTLSSFIRQEKQARLVDSPQRHPQRSAAVGILTGTLGYGALLLLAEGSQSSINRLNATLRRWLPPAVSWPIALLGFAGLTTLASDQVIVRQTLNNIARRARRLNDAVSAKHPQPTEPERTGSPQSIESWSMPGSKGRKLLASGPRARDIARICRLDDAEEPIRVFIGLIDGRTYEQAAEVALAELIRAGAFSRRVLAIMSSAGTGWLSPWSTSGLEFLSGGSSAIVAIQYSYLPSAASYVTDRESPVTASRILIERILAHLHTLPADARPHVYVSGESLGAYGIAGAFADVDELLAHVDGAVFSGAPRFTEMLRALTHRRDAGSPERLPVIDRGRHVRFAATPDHLGEDFSGRTLGTWSHPRVVFAQHASDPVVFWGTDVFLREPEWLREPGSRGVPAPAAQRLDVVHGMRWVPLITAWQVGLDQLSSLNFPGGHAHQYHEEMLYYWAAVLGEDAAVQLDDCLAARIAEWIRRDA
ncbi:alpha/beta-hydrolase family protein [Corynebacterium uterequi]|uniref:Putative membrane protein n=1 Tax=Corynebacterium uterequi TaxID=1072256 RepID=A0A0G3HFL1_9CORY|nr:alpha/beta-hydrolase family protein [Corynebacterium uterequi]AKK12104.1 putative membrane protein [Corynebacterium uterequi]